MIFLIAGLVSASGQSVLQLDGSTTVQSALETVHADLETAVGRKIVFNPTGSSVGLASLAAGNVAVAMISSSLEEIADKLNAKKAGSIDPARFQTAEIGRVKIAFIVNPRNRVRLLSSAQLADILTAKVRNWNEVGGDDGAITIISLVNGGPLIPDHLLNGAPITSTAQLVTNASQIPTMVAQQVNAIGIISTVHVKGPTSLVQTDAVIEVPLFLVTKGEPKAEDRKLIEAARRLLAGKK